MGNNSKNLIFFTFILKIFFLVSFFSAHNINFCQTNEMDVVADKKLSGWVKNIFWFASKGNYWFGRGEKYVTPNSMQLVKSYSNDRIDVRSTLYITTLLVANRTSQVAKLVDNFNNAIASDHNIIKNALHPNESTDNKISVIFEKARLPWILMSVYILKTISSALSIILLASFWSIWRTNKLETFSASDEEKYYTWLFSNLTGKSYKEMQNIQKQFLDNQRYLGWEKDEKDSLQFLFKSNHFPIVKSLLYYNSNFLINRGIFNRFLKDAEVFNKKTFSFWPFIKKFFSLNNVSNQEEQFFRAMKFPVDLGLITWLTFRCNILLMKSMWRYKIAHLYCDYNIQLLLKDVGQSFFYKPTITFAKNANNKQPIRDVLVTNSKEVNKFIRFLQIVKKKLKLYPNMKGFPSTIILIAGNSGSGKTTLLNAFINLLENEMAYKLIDAKKAIFAGKTPQLANIDTKVDNLTLMIAAIETVVKTYGILVIEDLDQFLTSRMLTISIENYVLINCFLQYFNVGGGNAEVQKFQGVAACTSSNTKNIDQAGSRRIETIIVLSDKRQKAKLKAQKLFITKALLSAYYDNDLFVCLDPKDIKFYLKTIFFSCLGEEPFQTINMANDILVRCNSHTQNLRILKGKMDDPDYSMEYSTSLREMVIKMPLRFDKKRFNKLVNNI